MAKRSIIYGGLFCFIASMLLVSSSFAVSEGPFILAHKKVSLTRIGSGSERVSVSFDIYNEGSSTAYDVSLNDDTWSQDLFTIVSGNTSVTWDSLDVGAVQSHSYELEAKMKSIYYGSPATITYRVPTKSTLQTAYSTPILPLEILAEKPPVKKLDWLKRILANHGSLVSVVSMVILFVYMVVTPSKSNASKGSKKKR